jgi:O-antigen ligase
MQIILGLLILVMLIGNVSRRPIDVAPGVTSHNALLALAMAMLVINSILGMRPKLQLRGLQLCFGFLIGYALLSTVLVAVFGDYQRYSAIDSLVALKAGPIEWLLLFVIYFYGTRSAEDAARLTALLLFGIGLSSVVSLWNASGLPQIGGSVMDPGLPTGLRRASGYFGHSNETGSLIAMLLPAMLVEAQLSKGFWRVIWSGLIAASVALLVMTLSRGAVAGLILGGIAATFICRRYISMAIAGKWLVVAAVVATLAVLLAGSGYAEQLIDRFVGVSVVSASDVSSGRTDIWTRGLGVMLERPQSLIVGVGWNTWEAWFTYLAHNQYLAFYFDLGIPGLVSFMLLFGIAIAAARKAASQAVGERRARPLAFVYSGLILLFSVLFTNLVTPWFYIWVYVALSMRYAMELTAQIPPARERIAGWRKQP